ncbi:MAG: ABC-F family ATP-binding cassette domain-containing protein [Chthonomonadaceae bacterium]|nr:ABC-F family ATP-binding cassette domain-containing protein [Chthonomonadaceae bacterium]
MLIGLQEVTKSFGARPLFRKISLGVDSGERVGLIGPNGSGKSTLVKILAGLEKPDEGQVVLRKGLRVSYVAQEDVFTEGATVTDALTRALDDLPLDEYEKELAVAIQLGMMGFEDPEALVSSLSGGWRKRLAITQKVIREPDVLILDEPTNHLDLQGVLWLEQFLQYSQFATLVVSHDRYFLERVATRVIELNRVYPDGYLATPGTYSVFLDKRTDFLAGQRHYQNALEKQVNREVDWLRRGPQARTTKAKHRIESAGTLIGELAEVKYRNTLEKQTEIDFSATQRRTKELLVAKNLSKTLGGRTLFEGVDLTLSPGSRLGLIGANGSGKTTLLKLLTGQLAPDHGTIKMADGLRIVLFDQKREQLDRKQTLRNALSPNSDNVIFNGASMHVAGWAKRFLFDTSQLEQPVGALSGGEQARVLIARMMLQPADLLILDEPTNDLDIPSLEALEANLMDFAGAVALVTHDRYMLDNVSTQLLAINGDTTTQYYADYAQWEDGQTGRKSSSSRAAETVKETATPSRRATPEVALRKLSTTEQKELSGIEAVILKAETEVTELQAQMSLPHIAVNHQKSQDIWAKIGEAEKRVTALYARWEELESKK